MKRTVKLIISGVVQGVGYRQTLYHFIHQNYLNVKGYVKNLSNGNVEAVFQGDLQDIRQIEKFCFRTEPPIDVTHIEKLLVDDREYESFDIKY